MSTVDGVTPKNEELAVEKRQEQPENSIKSSKGHVTPKLEEKIDDERQTSSKNVSTTSGGDKGYSLAPKPSKYVNKSQNTDPDVFEFHDSPESVIEKKETTGSVTLKHNGPYVFQSENLGQGGRDVNENVGTLGEASST